MAVAERRLRLQSRRGCRRRLCCGLAVIVALGEGLAQHRAAGLGKVCSCLQAVALQEASWGYEARTLRKEAGRWAAWERARRTDPSARRSPSSKAAAAAPRSPSARSAYDAERRTRFCQGVCVSASAVVGAPGRPSGGPWQNEARVAHTLAPSRVPAEVGRT